MVKANIGGSGAGIVRFDSADELRAAVADGGLPTSIDGVLLVQEYVPVRGGAITRIETLDRRLSLRDRRRGRRRVRPVPGRCLRRAGIGDHDGGGRARRRAARRRRARSRAAVELDVGGVEVMIDDRDGVARFYDINALSNFVAKPLDVLGWDPHDRLVDYLDRT